MDEFAANMTQFGGLPEATIFPAGMMSDTGVTYSPEQYIWMQQMYTQYLTQYMQLYDFILFVDCQLEFGSLWNLRILLKNAFIKPHTQPNRF